MDLLDVLAPVLGYQGTQDTNNANREIAQQNNAWSAAQYATRYQTQVKDLEAAGLNPMLAYGQSPGSAPTAQQVQFQNPMASAQQAFHQGAERDVMKQNIEKSKQEVDNLKADVLLKQAQAEAAQGQARASNASATAALLGTVNQSNQAGLTKAQTVSTYSQIQVNQATLPKIAQEIKTGGAQANFYKAAAFKAIAEGKITQADYDRALNEQRIERSGYGAVRPLVKDLSQITSKLPRNTTINRSTNIYKK